jgi:hypothetical protein
VDDIDLALHRPLHVGHFFRPLVDEQDDEHTSGGSRDRLRDALQEHGLAGARRRDDEAALPLADRRHQVHHAPDRLSPAVSSLTACSRIERREVLEEDLLARLLGRLEVDGLDLDQREVALPFLRRPDLARDRVAGVQVELADLRRRHVDVVRARQVVVVGRAQEAEAVGQQLEHAFREDEAALLGLRLQDLEDQVLLAHAGGAGDVEVLAHLRQRLDAHVLERGDVQAGTRRAAAPAFRGCGARRSRPLARRPARPRVVRRVEGLAPAGALNSRRARWPAWPAMVWRTTVG